MFGCSDDYHGMGRTAKAGMPIMLPPTSNGDFGSCSRCSRRRARDSSPIWSPRGSKFYRFRFVAHS